MTLFREAAFRWHQANQASDSGSSQIVMPRNFDDPANQRAANTQAATESTTQPAALTQKENTGTYTVGSNMQPPSSRPPNLELGVMNTWADTKGNIPDPENSPQLARTMISTPEGVKAEQALLARYVAMIQAAGAAHQRQA